MAIPVRVLDTVNLNAILSELGSERRIHYALDRFEAALKWVGNPQAAVKSLVVAGTNGKGSTALYLSSVLQLHGFQVGTYLSPHLQHVTERFVKDLKPTDEKALSELAMELASAAKKFELSYFEFLTLMYFVWAKRQALDFSVLEVGLGGRLDATNVTDAIACAIPSIGLDHQRYLGHTLEQILEEKLGILRPGSLLFTGVRDEPLIKRIDQRCLELDAIYYYSKDLKIENRNVSWHRQKASINGFPVELSNPSHGALENAALSMMLLRIVFPVIPMETIQKGLSRVKNPGRFEVVQNSPRVILSGDHNPAGVQSLLSSLDGVQAGKVKILCGFSPDKPHGEMVSLFRGVASELWLTEIPEFRGKMPQGFYDLGNVEPDPDKALDRALSHLSADETLLITGSLYLVGYLRRRWAASVSYL